MIFRARPLLAPIFVYYRIECVGELCMETQISWNNFKIIEEKNASEVHF